MSEALARHYHFRQGGVSDLVKRDSILKQDLELLDGGVRAHEHFLCCGAGTVAIVHADVFHRGVRAEAGQWRPMFKFVATSVSPPHQSARIITAAMGTREPVSRPDDSLEGRRADSSTQPHGEDTTDNASKEPLFPAAQAVLNRYLGADAMESYEQQGTEEEARQRLLSETSSEPERVDAAISLGLMVSSFKDASRDLSAAEQWANWLATEMVLSPRECVRRAATAGMAAASWREPWSSAAPPPVLSALLATLSATSTPLLGVAATSFAISHSTAATDSAASAGVITALSGAISRVRGELEAHCALHGPREERVTAANPKRSAELQQCAENLIDGTITFQRRAISSCGVALGALGAAACASGDLEVTLAAAQPLLLCCRQSDGATRKFERAFPTHFGQSTVRWNAAQSLLRIASAGTLPSSSSASVICCEPWWGAPSLGDKEESDPVSMRLAEALCRIDKLRAAGRASIAHEALAHMISRQLAGI